jgi:hypothetical protein
MRLLAVILAALLAAPPAVGAERVRIGAKCAQPRQAGPEDTSGAFCARDEKGVRRWQRSGDLVVRWATEFGVSGTPLRIKSAANAWCSASKRVDLRATDPGGWDLPWPEWADQIAVLANEYGWAVVDAKDVADSAWLAVCPSLAPPWWSVR